MRRRYRNTAFLVELMVNILVFCVSCAILVGLFGQAAIYSEESGAKAAAANTVQSLVARTKLEGKAAFAHGQPEAGGFLVGRYDDDWRPSDDEAAPNELWLYVVDTDTGTGVLRTVRALALNAEGETIYSVDTAGYIPHEGGDGA